MGIVIVVFAVVIVVAIVAALVFNPIIAKKNDAAVLAAKARLDGRPTVLEPRVVGFASDPPEAGAPTGQGCLGVDATTLVFVTTAGQREFVIPRSAITEVTTAGDPRSEAKTSLVVTYTDPTHGSVTASWRLPLVTAWLRELDYDWGPEGPPPLVAADED